MYYTLYYKRVFLLKDIDFVKLPSLTFSELHWEPDLALLKKNPHHDQSHIIYKCNSSSEFEANTLYQRGSVHIL